MEVRVKPPERERTDVCGLRAESHTKVSPNAFLSSLGRVKETEAEYCVGARVARTVCSNASLADCMPVQPLGSSRC